MSTLLPLLEELFHYNATQLEALASENPRIRKRVRALLDWLCTLEYEEMQRLVGYDLADTWHETEIT